MDLTFNITGICFCADQELLHWILLQVLPQSKARHLESIFGTSQDCTWELGLNTLEASCREFVSLIKDFAGGFYWLLNRELSFGTVFVKD